MVVALFILLLVKAICRLSIRNANSGKDVSTNGTTAGAATIPFNTDVKGRINTTTDNDYYKFVVTTGGTATITPSTENSYG